MMRALYSGVSGLRNHQVRMDVIGNNIANVNTVGFKTGRVLFKEMLNQYVSGSRRPQATLGGSNPMTVGLGMMVSNIDTLFSQGSIEFTGQTTDLAIQGEGFFVVGDGELRFLLLIVQPLKTPVTRTSDGPGRGRRFQIRGPSAASAI